MNLEDIQVFTIENGIDNMEDFIEKLKNECEEFTTRTLYDMGTSDRVLNALLSRRFEIGCLNTYLSCMGE